MRRRIGEFLFEIEKRYVNKTILIVTHGDPMWIMGHVVKRTPNSELMQLKESDMYPIKRNGLNGNLFHFLTLKNMSSICTVRISTM